METLKTSQKTCLLERKVFHPWLLNLMSLWERKTRIQLSHPSINLPDPQINIHLLIRNLATDQELLLKIHIGTEWMFQLIIFTIAITLRTLMIHIIRIKIIIHIQTNQMKMRKKVNNNNTMTKKMMRMSLKTQTKTLMLMKHWEFSRLRIYKDNSNNNSNKELHIPIKGGQKVG